MHRRQFLATSAAAATTLLALNPKLRAADDSSGRLFYDLRRYHFASPEKQKAYDQFLTDVGVPAYNRAGVEPAGVFQILAKDNAGARSNIKEDSTDLIVFLPHKNFESVVTLENRLLADKKYQSDGKAILTETKKSDLAYTRYESTLLLAMEGAPRIELPPKNSDRVFELRTYESPNNERHLNKLSMFNAGEFEVFKKANMPGVFFGGAIVGEKMPQLTYMVVHENRQAVDKNWAVFRNVPEWKKLSADPQYKNNVSNITNPFIRPTEASQI